VFEGTELTPYGAISSKAAEAARRGAKLLVVIEDPSHITDRARTVTWAEDPQIGDYPIPVVRIDRFRLAKAVGTFDFDALAHTIDATLTGQSRTMGAAVITYPQSLVALNPHASNVVGLLKGSDPVRAQEAIVIGAHYDHLGSGGRFALDPQSTGQIHNGADDNASGTALVIEMAHAAARQRTRFSRSIIFATFAGEEVGLLGSNYYVQHAPGGLRRTIAMINLDMVGRAHGRVMIGGTMKKPLLSALVEGERGATSLRLDGFQDGYGDGSSDNEPFEHEHVPTLLFFTGFHDDYHRPTDDWERIDARGATEIGRIVLEITEKLAK
jgi:Zn-dependent M28 family amino/carboxypeptidase